MGNWRISILATFAWTGFGLCNLTSVLAQLPYNPYPDPGYTLMGGYRDSDDRFFDYRVAHSAGMGWSGVTDQFNNKQAWWAGYKESIENNPRNSYNLMGAYFGIGAAYSTGLDLTEAQVITRMDSWLAPEAGIETYPELLRGFIISEENYLGDGKKEIMDFAARYVMENYGVPVFQWLLPEDQDDGGIPGTEPDLTLSAGGWVYNPVYHVNQDEFRKLTMKYVATGKPVHVNLWASDPAFDNTVPLRYDSVEQMITHGQGQVDVAREFNISASVFAVAGSSGAVNPWKGSSDPNVVALRDWVATVRADMNTVAPGMREPLDSANYSTGVGITGGSNVHDIPSSYQEEFLGFDWIEEANLTGFLDMQLTSAPETNPGHLLAKVHDADVVDSTLTYEITSNNSLGFVTFEVVGAAPSITNSRNSVSISTDGVNWVSMSQQAGNESLQTVGFTAANDILNGSDKAYVRVRMQNDGGTEGSAANALDSIKITTGDLGYAIWWNDWGTLAQQGAWSEEILDQPQEDIDGDGLANRIYLSPTDGKSYWGVERIEAPIGALIDDIRIEWEVETFHLSQHGVLWGIQVSTTGEFSGEQVSIVSDEGIASFEWETLVLDLAGNAEFDKLPYFYIRLWGDNYSSAISFDARPIQVYATYATIPEPATLTLLLSLGALRLRRIHRVK